MVEIDFVTKIDSFEFLKANLCPERIKPFKSILIKDFSLFYIWPQVVVAFLNKNIVGFLIIDTKLTRQTKAKKHSILQRFTEVVFEQLDTRSPMLQNFSRNCYLLSNTSISGILKNHFPLFLSFHQKLMVNNWWIKVAGCWIRTRVVLYPRPPTVPQRNSDDGSKLIPMHKLSEFRLKIMLQL